VYALIEVFSSLDKLGFVRETIGRGGRGEKAEKVEGRRDKGIEFKSFLTVDAKCFLMPQSCYCCCKLALCIQCFRQILVFTA
jgi:hypothetical protein